MNYPRFNELFWEFSEYIESLHALYLDSVAGYQLLHEKLDKHQEQIRAFLGEHEYATKEFQDTCGIAYEDLGGREHHLVSTSSVMRQGELRKRIEPEGNNAQTLGNLLVVSAYAYWEEYLRIELGKAMQVLSAGATNNAETRKILNREVRSDFWWDLRHLRNSIIHSHGIANSDMARCKIITWFKPGQRIVFSYKMIQRIFLGLGAYRNEIHNMQFPPHFIRIAP